jgi:1-acyl-sn-glycerol-3-phosphate acyltransferase
MYFARHVLIDRDSAVSAVKSLKKASRLMKEGISVVVFPEGTRSPDGEVKEFKRGAFLLALQSRAPIVPISISGTYEMLPRTGCCFRPGTIDLKIGVPIPTHELPIREIRPLVEKVRNVIISQTKSGTAVPSQMPKMP